MVRAMGWVLPVCCALGIGLVCAADWCELYPDSFGYLSAARRLAERGVFPDERMIAPPGFGGVVSIFMRGGDELPVMGLRLLFVGCWAGMCGLTFFLYRLELGRLGAGVVALLTATSGILLTQTSWLLSENLFGPVFIASLCAVQWAMNCREMRWGRVILAGALCGACGLVRSVGIVLIPAGVVVILVSRARSVRQRVVMAALFVTVAVMPHVGWAVRQSSYEAGYGYWHILTNVRPTEQTDARGFGLIAERFVEFVPVRLGQIKEAVLPSGLFWRAYRPPLDLVTSWLVGGTFVLLLLIRGVGRWLVAELAALFLLLLLCVWPWEESVRLVTCLVPIFFASLIWVGGCLLRRIHSARVVGGLMASCAVIVCLVHVGELKFVMDRLVARGPVIRERVSRMRKLADWQRGNVPEGKTISFVAAKGAPSRLLVAGGSYFARRRVEFVDAGAALSTAPDFQAYLMASSAQAGLLRDVWGREPRVAAEGLVWCGPGGTPVGRRSRAAIDLELLP
jgi:hypothetical protein